MNFKKMVLAAALAASFAPAFAGDQTIDLSSGQASFIGSPVLFDGGDDVISFINLAAGKYDFVLTISGQNITGFSGSFNGEAIEAGAYKRAIGGYLESTGFAPFTLTLNGVAGKQAGYSGELSVTAAVPEPGTYALMIAGLAGVGFVARRRRKA